jgi:hypothetical protein
MLPSTILINLRSSSGRVIKFSTTINKKFLFICLTFSKTNYCILEKGKRTINFNKEKEEIDID